MGLLSFAGRVGKDAAVAVTGAAAAVSGATYGAGTGAVSGAARGASEALKNGPRVTPAAALAVAAVGAAGLVEWPVLVLASSGALVLRQLRHQPPSLPHRAATPDRSAQEGTPRPPAPPLGVLPAAPRKATAPRKTSSPRKTTAPRKATRPRTTTAAQASSGGDRHVVPNADGGWDVKAPEASRASEHTDTQAEAISRAREITRNTGGQTVTHNIDGTVRGGDTPE